MSPNSFGRRKKNTIELRSIEEDLVVARRAFQKADYLCAFDIFEQMIAAYPAHSVALLAALFDCYQMVPARDRYSLYQSRHFHFGIKPEDRVLDIGSGHIPFPLATHLADITLSDHKYGMAGVPFKHVGGKPVYECNIEKLPFSDNEFDFVYCSHVLEHTLNPENACRELMRVARRGFIECPTRGKDLFLNSAGISQHLWGVDLFDGCLIFTEYSPEVINAYQCDILQQMHSAPQSLREKAFSALIYLKADLVNAMLLWDGEIQYEVRRLKRRQHSPTHTSKSLPSSTLQVSGMVPAKAESSQLRFLQIHSFYSSYLSEFYRANSSLQTGSFSHQIDALIRDGFSAIHIIAPYMERLGYESHFVVANNPISQNQWLLEHGIRLSNSQEWIREVARLQIEHLKPDVLYLSDPILLDSVFIRGLTYRPRLILGWRAAPIPPGTDWSQFDVMLSSLSALREVALTLGARAAEHFFPGYPVWINERTRRIDPIYDVVFSGQWTQEQHARRNSYLEHVARSSSVPGRGFSCGFYLSGEVDSITPDVARYNFGGRFGISMHEALRSGRILLDARSKIEFAGASSAETIDLAGRQTANMRIFEVTGAGLFLLSEYHENLSDYFTLGEEIETFRDETELVDKIHFYLAHPGLREDIARRGHERCLRDYSIEKRAADLDRIIKRHLAAKSPVPTISEPVVRLMEHASAALNQNHLREALDLLIKAKAMRQPTRGLDYLRAMTFIRMNENDAGRQALLEELRFFPDNQEAKALLESVVASTSRSSLRTIEDPEFKELLHVIRPYTMLSEERLFSLFTQARQICSGGLPGNFVECGVAAGGSSALLAYVIKRYSKTPRHLFSFDSFTGMPESTSNDVHEGMKADETGWGAGTCAAPEESVKEICARLGVLDVVTTVKGLFEETLPVWKDRLGMIAFLHLDGDWYESTKCILTHLYERICNDGYLQVDDYGYWEGCKKAVHEFEANRRVKFQLKTIDSTGVWFTKPEVFPVNPSLNEALFGDFEKIDRILKGIEGQMSPNERFQLFYVLREMLPRRARPLRFVEVGSLAGASLALTYLTLRKTGLRVEGFSVDPGRHPSLLRILEEVAPHIKYLPMLSHEAAPLLTRAFGDGNLPEVIVIDGDHTLMGVRQDIQNYWPLLAPGGIMVFHDWLPPLDDQNREAIFAHHGGAEPGIRQACAELLEVALGLSPLEIPLLYPTDPTQTQAHLPIIPGVFSSIRAYRKPAA